MESKLIDIPNNELDEIINQNIEQSEKVLIVVSFIFEKGLGLILDKLKKFHNPNNITIITSNYLKSTEPKALRKLLNLKSLGSKIYLFDSLTSNEKFHIKSYYFEPGFEKVAAACPVPIVIAGGKKLPEMEALEMAYKAIDQGAAGVDMGRNIFQSDCPIGMIQAVGLVVHENEKPQQAFNLYKDVKEKQNNN